MSKDLDTRAIFCGALDALTFQAPFRSPEGNFGLK